MPKIVYWNLSSRGDKNKPVQFDKNGTALVSGFSPSLLKSILGGEEITPLSMMSKVIDSERYACVTVLNICVGCFVIQMPKTSHTLVCHKKIVTATKKL
jgi:hypothetical protein